MSVSDAIRVYVAGPLSKGDVAFNVREAVMMADVLLDMGCIPFVPHLAHFWHMISPKPDVEWLKIDFEWIRVCHALLRIPGESIGADKEVQFAQNLGIPVFTSLMELGAWLSSRGETRDGESTGV